MFPLSAGGVSGYIWRKNFAMRKTLYLKAISGLAVVAAFLSSCEDIFPKRDDTGTLRIRFVQDISVSTKSYVMPDTNEFLLQVTDARNKTIYSGTFGAAPEDIIASPGSYTVTAKSCEFTVPAFDSPQYGDTQVAVVKAGETTQVDLCCRQINAGIRLDIKPSFLSVYPDAVLYLASSAGRLMYPYTERRIAYFQPGTVSLLMSGSGREETLLTRSLAAQEIVTLAVGASSSSGQASGGISVAVDTTRSWISDNYDIGGGTSGGTVASAYNVSQAREHVGESDVWVYGYIVGGDLSSAKCSFAGPFSSRTNLVIALKSSCRDKASCLSVQLSQGDIRNGLNLVDHPDNLGRQVYLRGDIVASYYGIPGIQGITEFELK